MHFLPKDPSPLDNLMLVVLSEWTRRRWEKQFPELATVTETRNDQQKTFSSNVKGDTYRLSGNVGTGMALHPCADSYGISNLDFS